MQLVLDIIKEKVNNRRKLIKLSNLTIQFKIIENMPDLSLLSTGRRRNFRVSFAASERATLGKISDSSVTN